MATEYIIAGAWKCPNPKCNMYWYWRPSMSELLTRGQIGTAMETRVVNFLCNACSYITAQDIGLLPVPRKPDIGRGEKSHYASRVALVKARCADSNCEFPVVFLAPLAVMLPEHIARYANEKWAQNINVVCAAKRRLHNPPSVLSSEAIHED